MKIKVYMSFPADKVTKPVTYHLIKDFDLRINILNADVSLNKEGRLVADFEGDEANIREGLGFLEREGIRYKLFNKSIIWQEDKCVHCGACTAVCPSGALQMDKHDWSLTFDKEKCYVCELCVKACPLKVMSV